MPTLPLQIYLPAIEGFVPSDVVRALRAFLDFCYLARQDTLNTDDLFRMHTALSQFHQYRKIFETIGIRHQDDYPPRQHSMMHYPKLIREFGAPNGLCSSITESKHIKAVKEPWRRSNRFNALRQMLGTNRRIDQLSASRVDFEAQGLLEKKATRVGEQHLT